MVVQEEEVFSPWDLDESMEIETGLRMAKRKEGGRSGNKNQQMMVGVNEWEGDCSRSGRSR